MQLHYTEYCRLLAGDEYIFTDVSMLRAAWSMLSYFLFCSSSVVYLQRATLNCPLPVCPPTGRPQVRPALWFGLEPALSFTLLCSSVQLGNFIILTSHCPLPLVRAGRYGQDLLSQYRSFHIPIYNIYNDITCFLKT